MLRAQFNISSKFQRGGGRISLKTAGSENEVSPKTWWWGMRGDKRTGEEAREDERGEMR